MKSAHVVATIIVTTILASATTAVVVIKFHAPAGVTSSAPSPATSITPVTATSSGTVPITPDVRPIPIDAQVASATDVAPVVQKPAAKPKRKAKPKELTVVRCWYSTHSEDGGYHFIRDAKHCRMSDGSTVTTKSPRTLYEESEWN